MDIPMYYLPMDCPNCGRRRLEHSGPGSAVRCEKCGCQDWDEGDSIRAQLAEAKAVLREVEWVNFPNGDWILADLCPVCGDGDAARTETGRKQTGHAPDCRLAKVLE